MELFFLELLCTIHQFQTFHHHKLSLTSPISSFQKRKWRRWPSRSSRASRSRRMLMRQRLAFQRLYFQGPTMAKCSPHITNIPEHVKIGMFWYVLACFVSDPNMPKHKRTYQNRPRPTKTYQNMSKHSRICQNISEHVNSDVFRHGLTRFGMVKTYPNILGLTCDDILWRVGTIGSWKYSL